MITTTQAQGKASDGSLYFVSYTARLLVTSGVTMGNYATAMVGNGAGLYTNGAAVGKQSGSFKNAVYLGFGNEWGGGSDTLYRYELSWQFAWAPLGPGSPISPYLGFRAGGMMFKGVLLTQGSLKPGVVLAPQAGLDLQPSKYFVFTLAMSYDANLGPSFPSGVDATLSGYSFDGGVSVRF